MAQALIAGIEQRVFRAAPAAETFRVEGWVGNLGRGSVGRTNSLTTFGSKPWDAFEAVETAERRYRSRNRAVRFRLTELDAEVDDLLFARGYQRSAEVLVMTLSPIIAADAAGSTMTRGVTPVWLEQYRAFRPDTEGRTAERGESLAALSLTHGVFSLEQGAVGVTVVDTGWAGMFDLAVDPSRRRAGLGRRLSQDMLSWAVGQGAGSAYLQVEASNQAASDLYQSLGFSEAYRYWYRSRD